MSENPELRAKISVSSSHFRCSRVYKLHFRFERISPKCEEWNFKGSPSKHLWSMMSLWVQLIYIWGSLVLQNQLGAWVLRLGHSYRKYLLAFGRHFTTSIFHWKIDRNQTGKTPRVSMRQFQMVRKIPKDLIIWRKESRNMSEFRSGFTCTIATLFFFFRFTLRSQGQTWLIITLISSCQLIL